MDAACDPRFQTLAALRAKLAQVAPPVLETAGRAPLGVAGLDEALGGGLPRAALHEVYAAAPADLVSATGFTVGVLLALSGDRPIVWIRQDFLDAETGRVNPRGLVDLGLDPGRLLLVRARDMAATLKAAEEAARCAALGAVLIEPWGASRMLDLTATRRLSLAAETAGVPAFLLRVAAPPMPSAAATRWLVAAHPSQPLEAGAPGHPSFAVTLQRQRGGAGEQTWTLEWTRDEARFRERPGAALPRPVVSVPRGRPRHAPAAPDRRRIA